MTLDDETRAVLEPDVWQALTWALAERNARHPHGGSEPTLDPSGPAVMLSCAVPSGVLAELDRVASRRGITRSTLVRAALALVLFRDAEWLEENGDAPPCALASGRSCRMEMP